MRAQSFTAFMITIMPHSTRFLQIAPAAGVGVGVA